MIQQDKGAADGTAWQQIAAFVFLESPRTTADQDPCRFLCEMKFLTYTTNFLRLKQPFASGLKEIQLPVGNLHIHTGMNTLLRLVTIPTRHIESNTLPFVGKSHGAHPAIHRRPCFRADGISHCLSP